MGLNNLFPSISGLDFEIHEFPVDYSLAPDVRCRSEHVGAVIPFRRLQLELVITTIKDVLLHSIVLMAGGEAISCGTIVPFSLPDLTAVVNFRTNAFGRVFILQWQG